MKELSNLFKPITADILSKSDNYVEIAPCDILKPYIRCFWGSPKPFKEINSPGGLVIPDCCMDIIFDIDYGSSRVENLFCSINDAPFYTSGSKKTATVSGFGIRFNFWAVHFFADSDLPKTCNEFASVDKYFKNLRKDIEDIIMQYHEIEERVIRVEELLIRKLLSKASINNNLLNGVYYILKSRGTAAVAEVSQYTCVSSRQLERIFGEFIGVTPKKCCSLVRYQNMWKDLALNRGSTVGDICYNYGYSDQAHMIKDFKKYHGSTPMEAVRILNTKKR